MSSLYYKPIYKHILFSDFVIVNIALLLFYSLFFRYPVFNLESTLFFLFSSSVCIIASLVRKNINKKQRVNLNDVIDEFAMTLISQLTFVLGLVYLLGMLHISKHLIMGGLGLFFLFIISHRLFLYLFRGKSLFGFNDRVNVTLIGDKTIANSLIKEIKTHPKYGYNVDEYISEEQLGNLSSARLFNRLLNNNVKEIFVCYKDVNTELLDELVVFGKENGIKIKVVYDKLKSERKGINARRSAPIVHLKSNNSENFVVQFVKRFFDLCFAVVLMVIGAPIFILIYLATKLTSKGPAFYKQERIGKNEKPFYIYKFRSMYINSEAAGPQLAKENDPRVTRWGLVMRKTRLDELPQFWNVMKGDMSIVGYRPERKHFIDEISKKAPEYKKLLCCKPGITSLGQIHYGYAENVDQMCERLSYDLLYTRNVNIVSDINIIFKTVRIMIERRGK